MASNFAMGWLVNDIIEKEVRNKLFDQRDTAIEIAYITKDKIKINILAWGKHNYIGIFLAVNHENKPYKSIPFEEFELKCYHDSCWRNEIQQIINIYEPELPLLGHIINYRNLDDQQQKQLHQYTMVSRSS